MAFCAAVLCGCPKSDSEDSSPGVLEFSSAAASAGESSGTATLTVRRLGGVAGEVSALVYINGGTASPGADYPWYIDYVESLHWADGDDSVKTVSLLLFDDFLLEGDETVELILASPEGGATLGATDSSVLTVVDSESPLSGSLQFSTDAYSALESAGTATLQLTRTLGSVGAVSVQVHRVHSAPPGMGVPEFLELIAELSWADGDATDKTVSFQILDDAVAEANEAVQFLLLSPTGGAALGSDSSTVLTLIDDD
ncbi:MAG TPA: Calx-beta domain-containing protein [Planctomycetota bacterium]|nr:Calx-beta domain-containing protein [Planctomycetota bacterium]